MTQLRKNASLTAVAEHATAAALTARTEWTERSEHAQNGDIAARFQNQSHARAAWERFVELAEIASHVRRLAGLEPNDLIEL